MAERDFLRATAAYDEAVAADPSDAEAVSKRDAARTETLAALLREAAEATRAKKWDAAVAALGRAFELADRWSRPDLGAHDLEQLTAAWLPQWQQRLDAYGPLALQRDGIEADALLSHARFAPLKAALQSAWSSAGASRCERAAAQASSSFLAALTKAYCGTLGHEVQLQAPDVPVFSMNPKVDNFVRGGSAMWPITVTKAFDDSPWASAQSSDVAAISASGKLDTYYTEQDVTKTALWQVSVPYQVTRYVQVPYTTYQSYSYPCGRSTCTGSRPITSYRTETRYETQYRNEPRSQTYAAVEKRATLTGQVNLFVDVRPLAQPLGIVVREETTETGLTHAAVPAASIPASTAQVATPAQWDERVRRQAETKLLAALIEHWRDAFCVPLPGAAEAAARCAWAGSTKPDELKPLNALFQDDLTALVTNRRFGH